MQDYTSFKIDREIVEVAKQIKDEVPYFMQTKIIMKAKRILKACNELIEEGQYSHVLFDNTLLVQHCLTILSPDSRKEELS